MTDGPTTPTPPPPGGMPGAPASLVERVKNILITPKTEWPRIDAEPSTIGGIYTSYVAILAAIGPVAMIIGHQVFGLGFGIKPSLTYTIGMAALTYVMSLVLVYVLAFIIDALAPSFGGTKDMTKAFKVAAYSFTAGWVAAIFNIIPMLGILVLIGALYGLYLLYLGLPRLMRVSEDKAVGYTVVVIVVYVVLYFVAAMIVGALVVAFFGAALMTAPVVRY